MNLFSSVMYNIGSIFGFSVFSMYINSNINNKIIKGILNGILFAIATIIVMLNPVRYTEGIVFDGRSIILSTASFFYGPITGFIAGISALILRLTTGGIGRYTGSLIIIGSVIIGCIFYFLYKKNKIRLTLLNFILFSYIIHIYMLIAMLTLPDNKGVQTIKDIFIFLITVYPLVSVGICKLISDLIDYYSMQEIIKEKELQLRNISNHIRNGMIYQIVVDKKNKKKFTYVSEYVKVLYGASPEEIMNNPDLIYNRVHPDDKQRLIDEENKALKNLSIFQTELRIINPDESIRWSSIVSVPRRLKSGEICFDGIEFVITESKNKELESIKLKELAEEANKIKSEFLSYLSHELKTPLNAIIGFTSILLEIENDINKVKYLNIIKDSSNQLLSIINTLLQYSKLDSGKYKIEYENKNIIELITNMVESYKIQAKNKGLDFIFEYDETLNRNIIIDSKIILQIINNLLSNTLKYTIRGSIKFKIIDLKNNIILLCKDTGIGINEKKLKNLYEPFEQGESNIIKSQDGTGLGLAIVKKLVDLLNGKINVKTEKNVGTEFIVKIPYTVI